MGGVRPDDADQERPTELVGEAPPTIDDPRPPAPVAAPAPGTALGRYLAIEESGRGGMGTVVRAYDPKLQREVALKRLHTSRLTDDARARLVREARAMAKLSHPNVVAVFDVEIDEAFGVMVVMEYVRGVTLRVWLRAEPRACAQVVDAFVAAGRGLAAAHAEGLLHRDFKPSNVLVSETTDGERRVRVTDFGLARPPRQPAEDAADSGARARLEISSDGPDESLSRALADGVAEELTSASMVMGTPTYMAPEQLAAAPLTMAADQYAFCVSLWEALVGRPPFGGSPRDLRRAKTKGPPPWPRAADAPRRVAAAIRRGLAPAPQDRWPSMDALLRELQTAVRPDRTRRLAIAALAGTTVIAVAWALWPDADRPCSHADEQLAGTWDPDRRTRTEAGLVATSLPYAPSTAQRIGDALDDYAARWIEMHTDACEATSVRREQSAAVLDARMACLRRAAVELDASADLLEHADAQVVEHADRIVAELAPLQRCADVEALMRAVAPPLPEQAHAVERVRAELAQARALLAAGKPSEAQSLLSELDQPIEEADYAPLRTEAALDRGRADSAAAAYDDAVRAWQSVLREAPPQHQWDAAFAAAVLLGQHFGDRLGRPEVGLAYIDTADGLAALTTDPADARLRTRNAVAAILVQQGKYAEAEHEYTQVLEARIAALGEDDLVVAQARAALAAAHRDGGHYPESETQFRLALAAHERALGVDHPAAATIRNNLAVALTSQGKYDDAIAELQRTLEVRSRVLPADHPDHATTRVNLAEVFNAQGRYADAERELELALAIRIAAFGERHPDVAAVRNNLTGPLVQQGKLDEAESMLRAALASWEAGLGADHPDVALARGNLAALLMLRGNPADAVDLLRAALPVWERALGPEHPDVALGRANLGRALHEIGRYAEAEQELRLALGRQIAAFGEGHVEVAATREALAHSLARVGKREEAVTVARAAVASFERELGVDHPDVARARRTLAQQLVDQSATLDEAIALFDAAWGVLDGDAATPEERAGAAFDLARALWSRPSQRRRARDLAQQAAATLASARPEGEEAAEVEAWLRSHP